MFPNCKLSGAKLSGAKLSGAKVSYNPDRICNEDLKELFFLSLFSKPPVLVCQKALSSAPKWAKSWCHCTSAVRRSNPS